MVVACILIGCAVGIGIGVVAYQIYNHLTTPRASYRHLEEVYRYSGMLQNNDYAK